MPTSTQYEVVKHQVKSFDALGYDTEFSLQPVSKNSAPKIVIKKKSWFTVDEKEYRFCDPDWDVVIMQLTQLYKTEREKNEKIKRNAC